MSERVEVHVEGQRTPPGRPRGSLLMMVPGLGFMAFGVAVLVWPRLIQIMVAVLFLLFGAGLLYAASRVNRVRRRFSVFTQFPPPGGPSGPPDA